MHQPTELSNLLKVLIKQAEDTLAALKKLDHYTAFDEASFEPELTRTAKLGDLLSQPAKFDHLGHRDEHIEEELDSGELIPVVTFPITNGPSSPCARGTIKPNVRWEKPRHS